ncbi:MAG TPA: PIN domain-containing protein [Bryobacteraceae bacterium]|nr:PIN domain-containing protein [Bryobacteraceae bacterium]
MKTGLVFDSWAILAYIYDETAAEEVENLMVESARTESSWISSINLGEVWYSLARRRSRAFADQQLAELSATGMERVDIDWPMVLEAAEYKSRHKISFADAFAAALAKQRNAELVTGDPEFRALESEIRIHWV